MDKDNKPLKKFVLMCRNLNNARKSLKTTSTFLLHLFVEITHVLWDPVYCVHLNIQQPVIYNQLCRLVTIANRTSLHLSPILLPATPFHESFPQIQIQANNVPHVNLLTPLKSCLFLLYQNDAQRHSLIPFSSLTIQNWIYWERDQVVHSF